MTFQSQNSKVKVGSSPVLHPERYNAKRLQENPSWSTKGAKGTLLPPLPRGKDSREKTREETLLGSNSYPKALPLLTEGVGTNRFHQEAKE